MFYLLTFLLTTCSDVYLVSLQRGQVAEFSGVCLTSLLFQGYSRLGRVPKEEHTGTSALDYFRDLIPLVLSNHQSESNDKTKI